MPGPSAALPLIGGILAIVSDPHLFWTKQRAYCATTTSGLSWNSLVGKFMLFSTTTAFLERLGVDSLRDLPPLADFVPESSLVEALERGLRGVDVELDSPGDTAES